MPPAYVKTYRDLVHYESAKMASVAAGRPGDARFILERVKALRAGTARLEDAVLPPGTCIYDGATATGEPDWLVPPTKGGLEISSNLVPVCDACRAAKGSRDVLAWHRDRRLKVPRNVWKRFMRVMYEIWDKQGVLEAAAPASEFKRWSTADAER